MAERSIVPWNPGNSTRADPGEGREREVTDLWEGNMPEARTSETMSTRPQQIAERAKRSPEVGFTSRAHRIDLEWLHGAYQRTRPDGAAGVDGPTAADDEEDLMGNLQSLLDRAKSGTYRAPPVRRVHIPKGDSTTETRPIGIPTYEDKGLQRAVVRVLETIDEQDFLDGSYGVRPGRSAHQALPALWQQTTAMKEAMNSSVISQATFRRR